MVGFDYVWMGWLVPVISVFDCVCAGRGWGSVVMEFWAMVSDGWG